MPIKHKKIPTTEDKVTLEDWTDPHDITNIGGLWELVEKKTIAPGGTSCTFSNLDGDSDEQYLIDFELYFPDATDSIINIAPNGVATNQKSGIYGNWSGSVSQSNYAYWWFTGNGWKKIGYSQGQHIIRAKTGRIRSYKGYDTWTASDLSAWLLQEVAGWWNNLVDNITSLVITVGAGSFSGTIALYKKIPL